MKPVIRYVYKCYSFIRLLFSLLIESGFNGNTGYFYYIDLYLYEGKVDECYILCKGYKIFWINGHERIDCTCDKDEFDVMVKKMNVEVTWKQIK